VLAQGGHLASTTSNSQHPHRSASLGRPPVIILRGPTTLNSCAHAASMIAFMPQSYFAQASKLPYVLGGVPLPGFRWFACGRWFSLPPRSRSPSHLSALQVVSVSGLLANKGYLSLKTCE